MTVVSGTLKEARKTKAELGPTKQTAVPGQSGKFYIVEGDDTVSSPICQDLE